jgi:hypothetical protein
VEHSSTGGSSLHRTCDGATRSFLLEGPRADRVHPRLDGELVEMRGLGEIVRHLGEQHVRFATSTRRRGSRVSIAG